MADSTDSAPPDSPLDSPPASSPRVFIRSTFFAGWDPDTIAAATTTPPPFEPEDEEEGGGIAGQDTGNASDDGSDGGDVFPTPAYDPDIMQGLQLTMDIGAPNRAIDQWAEDRLNAEGGSPTMLSTQPATNVMEVELGVDFTVDTITRQRRPASSRARLRQIAFDRRELRRAANEEAAEARLDAQTSDIPPRVAARPLLRPLQPTFRPGFGIRFQVDVRAPPALPRGVPLQQLMDQGGLLPSQQGGPPRPPGPPPARPTTSRPSTIARPAPAAAGRRPPLERPRPTRIPRPSPPAAGARPSGRPPRASRSRSPARSGRAARRER